MGPRWPGPNGAVRTLTGLAARREPSWLWSTGQLVWFLERGGRTLLSFTSDPDTLRAAAGALADLVTAGRMPSLLVERINGVAVLDPGVDADRAAVQEALTGAGFSRTPRGLRLR